MQPRLELETSSGTQLLGKDGVLIGRARECGLRFHSKHVSRRHARVTHDGDGWWIEDLDSTNGTSVDGAIIAAPTLLRDGTTIRIGEQTLRVLTIHDTAKAGPPRSASHKRPTGPPSARRGAPLKPFSHEALSLSDATVVHRVVLGARVLKIGRDRSNDVKIRDPNVSRFHAELRGEDGAYVLRDLGSLNGTRLEGKLVESARVGIGSEIGIGAFRIVLTAAGVQTTSSPGCLIARGVQQHVKRGLCVLQPTDLSLVPGELVALIGETGSGKSTLVKILAGVTRPSAGSVLIDGEQLALRLPDVGYVPQADFVHRELTAREALTYGARLRLPPDTSPAEVDAVVERVLVDLDLLQHADRRIGTGLSGGQQRRVSVGMELLGSPRILLLDEPGSSLDVRLERQLTDVLRNVARGNCAVVAITHRTSFLERFDRLLVMGSGGVLCFDGSPREALERFGVGSYEAIYDRLAELDPPAHGAARPTMVRAASGMRPTLALAVSGLSSAVSQAPTRPVFGHHLRVLAGRTARVLSRDVRNLVLLLAQAPVLAAVAATLFGAGAFALTKGNAEQSAKLLFALVLVATWVGVFAGIRALIGERTSFVRERALGVPAASYLTSKLLVLGALGLVQTMLLALVAFTIAPLHSDVSTYLIVVGLLALATQVGLVTGLLLSALASTTDQAITMLSGLLVLQFLCAGAIVAVKEMGSLEPLSTIVSSRWALAGVGSAMELSSRRSANGGFLDFYGTFFNLSWTASAVVLMMFLGVLALLIIWRLRVAWRE